MYFKQNKLDSVFKYTKLMHDMMPLSIKFYEPYVGFMSSKRDTMGISTAFKNLDHSKLKPDFFKATYNALIASGANKNASIKVIEEGIQLNPTDTILNDVLGQYKIEKGRIAEAAKSKVVVTKQLTQQQQFEQILNQNLAYYNANKTDMAGAKNVGLCYFQLQNYSQAIVYMKKVVASKKFTNGEAEYVLAASYAKLNDKNNACQYAQDGLAKGLAICKNIIDLNCK
jgi:tetratricopeptide (TPR) repeat protein